MLFFMPRTSAKLSQAAYDDLAKSVKDQMRLPMTDRRIFALDFVQDKRNHRAQVGEPAPQHPRYTIVAIFESKPYIIATRSADQQSGITVLVNPDDVTAVVDFE